MKTQNNNNASAENTNDYINVNGELDLYESWNAEIQYLEIQDFSDMGFNEFQSLNNYD